MKIRDDILELVDDKALWPRIKYVVFWIIVFPILFILFLVYLAIEILLMLMFTNGKNPILLNILIKLTKKEK